MATQKSRLERKHHLVFLIVWVLLAIASFYAAYRLTHRIVSLSKKPIPTIVVGVYGAAPLADSSLVYTNNATEDFVRVYFPNGTTEIVLSGAKGNDCEVSQSASKSWDNMARFRRGLVIRNALKFSGPAELFDVRFVRGGGTLQCDQMQLGMAEHFTTDVVRIYYPSTQWGISEQKLFGTPKLDFSANVANSEHFQMIGSKGYGGAAELTEGDDSTVRWDLTTYEAQRDLFLVIIGSLIAFGAALCLEAVRNLIEIVFPEPD
jgi:hypothetical protein